MHGGNPVESVLVMVDVRGKINFAGLFQTQRIPDHPSGACGHSLPVGDPNYRMLEGSRAVTSTSRIVYTDRTTVEQF